jgi:hypothetical protein
MTLEISILARNRHKNVVGFNRLLELQPSLLDHLLTTNHGKNIFHYNRQDFQ